MNYLAIILVSCLCVSCASSPMLQPQINGLVIAQRYPYALKILNDYPEGYGAKNKLLYSLDRGMVLHLAKNYRESVAAFEEAKDIFDQLLTKSISNQTSTWLMNDNAAFYRGEDFERALINVFQSLNFFMLGEIDEAIVEARDVDLILSSINRQYQPAQKNVYKDDAFIRTLMGILYESGKSAGDINDAHISYAKAVEIYESDYEPQYKVKVPRLLKENILATAEFMGVEELEYYRGKFPDIDYLPLTEKSIMGEVFVIDYHGYSPVKYQMMLPIPLPEGYIVKLAFPKYVERIHKEAPGQFKAVNSQGKKFLADIEIGEDIAAIARKNLENRQARVIAKATLRAGAKYAVERQIGARIESSNGRNAANIFRYLSSLYNITSEQADLRSWMTLPAEIRLTRLILPAGSYELFFNETNIEAVTLKPGEKKVIIIISK